MDHVVIRKSSTQSRQTGDIEILVPMIPSDVGSDVDISGIPIGEASLDGNTQGITVQALQEESNVQISSEFFKECKFLSSVSVEPSLSWIDPHSEIKNRRLIPDESGLTHSSWPHEDGDNGGLTCRSLNQ